MAMLADYSDNFPRTVVSALMFGFGLIRHKHRICIEVAVIGSKSGTYKP